MSPLPTRAPRLLSRATMEREEPIIRLDGCDGGFEYSDAYLHDNDARFVWNFVRASLDHGAVAANYVESLGAKREGDLWITEARDVVSGARFSLRSRAIINACGPYVDAHNALSGEKTRSKHVFSKGIHLIVDRLTPHKRVLTFFADDGRLFFVIPMGPRTCIGTTDTKVDSPITQVTAGLLSGSQGLIADGVHSLSDLIADFRDGMNIVDLAIHQARPGVRATQDVVQLALGARGDQTVREFVLDHVGVVEGGKVIAHRPALDGGDIGSCLPFQRHGSALATLRLEAIV
mgnify:CR=1 FL=1